MRFIYINQTFNLTTIYQSIIISFPVIFHFYLILEILITSSQYHHYSHEGCYHLFNKVISYIYDLSLSYHELFYI